MTREQAAKLVNELVEAVNMKDTRRLLRYYADDAVTISPVSGQIRGRAAIADWWHELFARFPDWRVEVSDVLVDGNRIAFFGTAAATDTHGWFGQPATGEQIDYRTFIVLTFVQGKIARDERVYDLSGVLQRLEKARLEKELNLAGDLQRALFSRSDHATTFCESAGGSVPCRAIGGDFFESMHLPCGDFAVALGDVAGKGPASALLAAMIQGMFSAEIQRQTSPSGLFTNLNQLLMRRHLEPRFATVAYAVLSSNGQLRFSNAGHNPPVLLTKGGARRLVSGGPVLGLLSDSTFEEEMVLLNSGDTLIMFSDGVTEARDAQGEEFGEDRLLVAANALRERPVDEIVTGILQTVQLFGEGSPQADDMAVLVVRFLGNPAIQH